MKILDCTLRDGANVVGLGFDAELTRLMIEGLLHAGIGLIEFGNAHGMGMNEPGSPLDDAAYLELMQPYKKQAEFGMFLQAKAACPEGAAYAARNGLKFLRVGNNAGDARGSERAVKIVKEAGLTCRYSIMKAYLLTPEELAGEAALLETYGVDEITVMDSAGTMLPRETAACVKSIKESVSVPIGFHGHNNLGLSIANALAALENGAEVIDTGLMGMARSAGNCPTEVLAAVLSREGYEQPVDLFRLLEFIEDRLIPAMDPYGYKNAVPPVDLIYGLTGCHSNFGSLFRQVASEKKVPLYPLIAEVSKLERKAPSRELIERVASERI